MPIKQLSGSLPKQSQDFSFLIVQIKKNLEIKYLGDKIFKDLTSFTVSLQLWKVKTCND